ncbi:MAG: nickel-dependent lactate racemase [Bacteroidota bacterium]
MKVTLAYGKEGVSVDVPDRNLRGVLAMRATPALAAPAEAVRASLEKPMGGKPLALLARGGSTACVVISDVTRPVPNALILPPLLSTLERSGIRREDITILVATGLHRPGTQDELRAMVGEEIRANYRIIDHHARVEEEQEYLGRTKRGTPVYIDRAFVRADLKITTGFVEPHLMAGFSGGRKLVAPGCAGEETIKALHSPAFLEDPRCCEGSIEENPLHHELLQIAQMTGHDFIVNVALDSGRGVTGVFAGDPLGAHAAAVAHVRGAVGVTLSEPVDIAITSSAGYPLDLTYYQAVKGVTAALPVVKKGGMLIVAAECAEGLGSREFTEMATRFQSADEFIREITTHPVVIDQWQLEECAKAARHAEVVLVSPRVHREFAGMLFVRTAEKMDDALRLGLSQFGPDASVAVIPQGPYTLVGVR